MFLYILNILDLAVCFFIITKLYHTESLNDYYTMRHYLKKGKGYLHLVFYKTLLFKRTILNHIMQRSNGRNAAL